MTSIDWQWKIKETIERIRTRYDFIGHITGAPFISVIYPTDVESALFKEWHIQIKALDHNAQVISINVLDITHQVLNEIGIRNVLDVINNPMPGSDTKAELGHLWIDAIAKTLNDSLVGIRDVKPVISLEKLSALYPAAGPRDLMQYLWDSIQTTLSCPVIVFIPGVLKGPRTYSFLGKKDEFMYRGDIL